MLIVSGMEFKRQHLRQYFPHCVRLMTGEPQASGLALPHKAERDEATQTCFTVVYLVLDILLLVLSVP